MAAKEIEKLREKFDSDPNSKLFLPLGEEYRKEGLLDEAIDVLQRGLEKHASYTSARVLLGKIFLEKGLMDEARKEFESVIKIVPDNLYAHKKLAEVYRDTGETDLAIKAFKAILKLNPMDEETIGNLNDIEAAVAPAVPEQNAGFSEEIRMPGVEAFGAEESIDIQLGGELQADLPDIQVEHSDDELNAFKDSLFGDKSGLGDETDHEIHSEASAEPDDNSVVSLSEDDADLSFEDVSEALAEAEIPAPDVSFAESTDDETIELVDESLGISDMSVPVSPEDFSEKTVKASEDLSDADSFVAQEKFAEAMGVYRRFLKSNPGNRQVLQRIEELKSLLKLMGKDKEVLIDKLNALLEGITKGHDEFLGRS